MIKTTKVLIAILLLAALLRIIFLNEIPPGFVHDEIQIALNAQSLAKTGNHIPGILTGIIGNTTDARSSSIFAELSSFILVPWAYIFNVSWPWIKLPFLFFNLLQILFIFGIAKKLWSTRVGLIAALLIAINPWSIHQARTLYEYIAFVFYFGAVLILLTQEKKRIFWALPLLVLGFGTYFAAKPQMILIALFGLMHVILYKRWQTLKPMLALTAIIFILTIGYFLLLKNHVANTRLQELTQAPTQEFVTQQRGESLNVPLKIIYANKLMYEFKERTRRFLDAVSWRFLFFDSEANTPRSQVIPGSGFLYIVDLPLVLFASYMLLRRNKKMALIIGSLFFIGILPGILSRYGPSLVRSGFGFPVLVLVSAYSISLLTKKYRFTRWFVAAAYGLCLLLFVTQYFIWLPVTQASDWYLHERVLARYLKLAQDQNLPVLVVTRERKELVYAYLLFSGKYRTAAEIRESNLQIQNKTYSFGSIQFVPDCPKEQTFATVIFEELLACPHAPTDLVIANLKDAGTQYTFVGEKLCADMPERRFPQVTKIEELAVESYDYDTFCEFWITNPLVGNN